MARNRKRKSNFWLRFLRSLSVKQQLFLAALFLTAFLLSVVMLLLRSSREYRSLQETGQYEKCYGPGVSCIAFGDGYLRYSRDGFSYLDARGKQKWNQAALLDTPSVELRGSYGIIGDLQGTRAFIFDRSGILGSINLTLPLLNMRLSEQGVAALVLDDGSGTRIDFYDRKGKRLDIELTLEMSVSGFPVDIALSPDGNGLAVSMSTSTSGILKSRLVFYNFSTGKNVPNRLVGYFEYEGVLFPEIRYLNAKTVAAVGDDRLVFLDLSNEVKPAVKTEYSVEGSLQSIVMTAGRLAIVENEAKSDISLRVFDANGEMLLKKTINETCERLSLTDRYVMVQTADKLLVLDMKGRSRLNCSLLREGPEIFLTGKRNLVQFSGSDMYTYKMK